MKLPVLISSPHGGWRIPHAAGPYCALTPEQIAADGDEGAWEIYTSFRDSVNVLVTTDMARAIVDMNRAEDDRGPDGVVKTHTCWNVPVYREFPPEIVIRKLLEEYYRPYHTLLSRHSKSVQLGIDCHTMAAKGPPIGPDPDAERPAICLSNGKNTCPDEWLTSLAGCFEEAFDRPVSINHPFRGGYIIQHHTQELPWIQLEVSRAPFLSNKEKAVRVLESIRAWCKREN